MKIYAPILENKIDLRLGRVDARDGNERRKIINFFKLKLKKNAAGEKVFIIFVFLGCAHSGECRLRNLLKDRLMLGSK